MQKHWFEEWLEPAVRNYLGLLREEQEEQLLSPTKIGYHVNLTRLFREISKRIQGLGATLGCLRRYQGQPR